MIPPPQTGSAERQPLLHPAADPQNDLKHRSWLYRARRAPVAVACVVAMALFTDMVVYGVVVPLLPYIVVERLGGSSSEVGLLFACYAIGLLASTPVFAILSDKYQNRRIPMMVGMLGLAVATVGFSMATNYWVLIIARIGQGSAGGASWTIGLGMLADVYPADNLGTVMGATMMANAIGFIVGPLVGGYLYEFHGYAAPFIFCAALAVIDFLCILFLAEPQKFKAVPASSSPTTTTENAGQIERDVDTLTIAEEPTTTLVAVERTAAVMPDSKAQEFVEEALHPQAKHIVPTSYGSTASSSSSSTELQAKDEEMTDISMFKIAGDWTITCCLLATFVAASVFSGMEPILPLYLKDMLNAGPTMTSLIFVAAIVPTLFASGIGYYADKLGHFYVSLAGMILFAIATFALALPSSFVAFIPPLALFGLGSSMILTPLLPAMAAAVNKRGWVGVYGKTYALYNMVYATSMAVGPILAGYVFDDFGFRLTMVLFGVMIVVAIPIIFAAQVADVLNKWRQSRSVSTESEQNA